MNLFSSVQLAPKDPIFGLTEAYTADQRPTKVNLGVGVYYTDEGKVPLLKAVLEAEREIVAKEAPRAYIPILNLTGSDLVGAKLDAIVSFPNAVKGMFATWRVAAEDVINGRDVYVVQGNGQGGIVGTLYFDKQSHLLVRFLRRTPSPVGRITIQQDFDNYKDVDGIKFPFKYSFLWLDGRFTAEITDVKVNVPVEAAKLTKP